MGYNQSKRLPTLILLAALIAITTILICYLLSDHYYHYPKYFLVMYQPMLHEYHNKVHCLLCNHVHTHSYYKHRRFTCLLLMVSFSRKCRRTVDGSSIRQFHKTCWATALTLEKKINWTFILNGHKSVRYSVQVISKL